MTNLTTQTASATKRIADPRFIDRLRTPQAAAAMIAPDATLAISGFGGAGHPKAVLPALAELADEQRRVSADSSYAYALTILSGASTAADLDGRLAAAGVVSRRVPYNADPQLRRQINDLDGAHDIYQNDGLPQHGTLIPLKRVDQRIGQPHLTVDFDKAVAVVQSDLPDDSPSFAARMPQAARWQLVELR